MIGLAMRGVYALIDRPALAAAIAAPLILWGVWSHGDRNGEARVRAENAALVEARKADGQRILRLADQLAEAQAERDAKAKELEDAARNDPGAGNIALPAGSVLRIDSR